MIETCALSHRESYSATMEPHRPDGPRVYVSRTADNHEVRISFADRVMQAACYMTPAEAADVRDMLSQALGTDAVQASGDAHALRMIADALQVPEAERHDGGIMRAIERLQADRDRLADIVEHKYGSDDCDGCADRDLRIEELEAQLLGRSTSSRMEPTVV